MPATRSVPGPQALPVLGPARELVRFLRDPIRAVGRLFHDYGPIAALVVGARTRIVSTEPNPPGTIFLHGPDLMRDLLTNHADFHKCGLAGPLYPEAPVSERKRPVTRMLTGLFHVNEGEHKQHRRLLMPAFHRSRIESYRDEMVRAAEALLAKYELGTVRDVRPDMMEVTLRIATSTLFGEDLGERGLAIGREVEEWSVLFRQAAIFPFDLPGAPYRRWLDLAHAVDRGIHDVIREKRAQGAPTRDMLSMLLEARDEAGASLSEDELVGHAGVIFAAGHETSSNALSWTLFLLAQHPAVLADLCEELTSKLHGDAPTFDQLSELPLLDRVIKESLRIFPPAPLNHRVTARDSSLGEYHIPAGTEVLASIYHTHRLPEIYPDPLVFRPDRWIELDPGPYAFNPFSAGPRMCIGATFALFEIKIVLALLLQRFRFELAPRQVIDRQFTITLAPAPRVLMRLERPGAAYKRPAPVRGNTREMVRLPRN